MNIGELKEQLADLEDDTEVYFGGLDFYRLKHRGDKLVHFEFNQTIYEDQNGQIFLENYKSDIQEPSHKLQGLKDIPISNIESQLALGISQLLNSEPTIEGSIETLSFEFGIIEPTVNMKVSFARKSIPCLDDDLLG